MNLPDVIASGVANPVALFLMALILGCLHGVEPGTLEDDDRGLHRGEPP